MIGIVRAIAIEGGLSIVLLIAGFVRTIAVRDCLLFGIVGTIDFGDGQLVKIIRTTDYGDCLKLEIV